MALKRGPLIVTAGVIVVGVLAIVNIVRDNSRRVSVRAEKVARADLVSVVSAFGNIRPRQAADIGANVSGRVVELLVSEGQSVTKGQVLARIESEQYQAQSRQAEAAMESSQAELERADADLEVSQLNLQRIEQIYRTQLVAQQEYDQARAEVKMKAAAVRAMRRRVSQLRAALDSSRDELRKTVVRSSMDGVLTSIAVNQGEVVIGAQSFSPTVLMTVSDLSIMEAEIWVDETDIYKVALGQTAQVRVDALEGTHLEGDVTAIGSSAVPRGGTAATTGGGSTGQTRDFKVVVTLKAPPASLRPGVNATAEITTARRQNVVAVPVSAVVVRAVGKEGTVIDTGTVLAADETPGAPAAKGEEKDGVFVVAKGLAVFRPVQSGIVGETAIEIVSGLEEGEEVVTGSYKTLRTLKDRAHVKVEKVGKK